MLNNGTGFISGTPTTAGPFAFTGQVTDTGNTTAAPINSNCNITVASPPPVTSTCVSITAQQGVAITPVTLTGSGGVGGPYTFSAVGLPTGLTISAGGLISGTPMQAGTFPYVVTIKDRLGNAGTLNCSVFVAPPVQTSSLSVLCAPGSGTVGQAFSATVPVTGGVSPYVYSIAAGALPTGLSLSASGVISGTPGARRHLRLYGESGRP